MRYIRFAYFEPWQGFMPLQFSRKTAVKGSLFP
jgi:hypothetical protein